ncbi:MAG: nucleotidyltransferase domain-containing protein [Candidatus Scalindua sp.]|nr:nucleotidyltransferase domain-containing protein [Candidatus Scalindua sp.]
MDNKIKVYANSLEKLKDFFVTFLKDEDVKVVLFGSRATGEFVSTSDVDIGIIMGKNADKKTALTP